jgi:vacuolar-type H+-ATPase subunit I/STV1
MFAIVHDPMQLLSFLGALLILIAYAGHQLGKMNPRSVAYNLLNAIGSGILGYVALFPFKLGFVFLETSWVLISFWAMFRKPQTDSR